MFARRAFQKADIKDLQRVEALVRDRYGLPGDAIVLVGEEDSRLPGGPDRMTTILFWDDRQERCRLRLFKPVAEVVVADLPAAWLRRALRDDGEGDCC